MMALHYSVKDLRSYILLTLFLNTINGTHISEESITVQYWCPYDAGSQARNGSVQLKLNEPAIEIVSSTSLKLFMENSVLLRL
jgi:hypothetical protein